MRWTARPCATLAPGDGWTACCPGSEEVGFAWVVLLAVLRLTTRPAVFAHPLRPGEAVDVAGEWLAQRAGVPGRLE